MVKLLNRITRFYEEPDDKNIKNWLDSISNLLTATSLIPGLDTFTNLASIPVDIARGDWLSAGLSAIGAIPVVGEAADTAKLAKIADKAVDAAKVADKVSDVGKAAVKMPKLPKTPAINMVILCPRIQKHHIYYHKGGTFHEQT